MSLLQLPHCGSHPKRSYTAATEAGLEVKASSIWDSVNALQIQTYIWLVVPMTRWTRFL